MAIVFTSDVSQTKLLMAYNNQIVQFYSNTAGKVPLNAEISIIGVTSIIYPHPNGSFYLNLKRYLAAVVNTNKFRDPVYPDIDPLDVETYIYNAVNGTYVDGPLTIKINFTDLTFESANRNIKVLNGVQQLYAQKKYEIQNDSFMQILSPISSESSNQFYVRYWTGYPFEFSFYTASTHKVNVINERTLSSVEMTPKGRVNSVYLCDGSTDTSIDTQLQLVEGYNKLKFVINLVDIDQYLTLVKEESCQGIYIKWLNNFGRWNYWLFKGEYMQSISAKNIGEIENDFYNLESTISPTMNVGKTAEAPIKVQSRNMTESDRELLSSIMISPRIYMFTGTPFSKAEMNDWMEVRLKTGNFPIKEPGRSTWSVNFEFELPSLYTQTL